jgi:hypothetical protein
MSANKIIQLIFQSLLVLLTLKKVDTFLVMFQQLLLYYVARVLLSILCSKSTATSEEPL